MAEALTGYRDIPEEDQKKANSFFERGKTVADTGNYEYAVELFLQGLAIDPDAREAHEKLREISLKRKASGGKSLPFTQSLGLKKPTKDDKQNMLNAEKLLAYDPPERSYMLSIVLNAHKAGFYDSVLYFGGELLRANASAPKPDIKYFLQLKDVYKDIRQWKKAIEAIEYALKMNPDDMDLQKERKDLGAEDTMEKGDYAAGDFRKSMRNRDFQERLLAEERDYKSEDLITKQINEAAAAYQAEPIEGKMLRYVEVLEKTEDAENESKAMELLQEWYNRTKQFRFRQRLGKLQMAQMKRMERSMRMALEDAPDDQQLKKEYEQLKKEQLEFERDEFALWAENYPTDLTLRYELAARLFALEQYDEAIPAFQQARVDPKIKNDASIALGRSFLAAGFVDEAIETLQVVIDEYQLKGDERSKQMYYWQGRALEEKGNSQEAIKRFSQVAQWEFTYKDVQQRIKRLRAANNPAK